ncbi:MAG: arylsulfatase, partial [Verrucomicrobia bacterium]|nr:arylsulfatase [Verrucomicrobiota bacterium]
NRLPAGAQTYGHALQRLGYHTAHHGKWHLGDEGEYQPGRRGFSEVFIHGAGGIGQSYPGSCGDAPGNKYFDPYILHNGKFEKTQGYCTDVFYGQATQWMDTQRKSGKPFFCYIPSNAPHGPYIARPEDKALYDGKAPNDQAASFLGMVHNIDQNIGKVLAKLDEWGIAKDTLVVFMNDNGGTAGVPVWNAGMRGSKGSAWLGGTRASSFWRWPGTLKPADCGVLAANIDFFPTIAEITGAKLTDEVRKQVEGRSLVSLLENPASSLPDRVQFTHLGRWPKMADPNLSKFAMCSVRNTRWQLISPNGGAEPKWQLFDVKADPGQETNVAAQHPEVVKQLAAAYDQWWSDCQPLLVNEKVVGPKLNPFAELYWKQFGGGPTEADYKRMDPARALEAPEGRKKGKAK